jgi:hypothetical protein
VVRLLVVVVMRAVLVVYVALVLGPSEGSRLRTPIASRLPAHNAVSAASANLRLGERRVRPYGSKVSERPLRRAKWSQVAVPRIGPRTNLHPPRASGGNMYLQRAHLTSGVGAGR